MTADPNLVNLCNFRKPNNKNLDLARCQITLRPNGINLKIVLKYVQSNPNKEVLTRKMGI